MPSDGLWFDIARMVSTPRTRVFESFADATQLKRWWGPRGFSIPNIDYVPRVGASYRIQMRPHYSDTNYVLLLPRWVLLIAQRDSRAPHRHRAFGVGG